jgi:hypothetical protein
MTNKIYLALAFFLTALSPQDGRAADIFPGKNALNIVGQIRPGDAERFAQLASEQVTKNKSKVAFVFVNSPGGDVAEAIRITDLISGMKPDVYVANGGVCASSCFLIFLAGYQRVASWVNDDGSMPTREKLDSRFGLVGIHRPYLKTPSADIASVKQQEELMRRFRLHLAERQVPQYLVDEMMARPSNDIYWLRERDLELVGPMGAGDEEALIARCGYKRIAKIADEKWTKERVEKMIACEGDYWFDQYFEAQISFAYKLSRGWRPWTLKK